MQNLKPTAFFQRACLALILLVGTTSCTSFKSWVYEGFDRDEWQHPEQVIKTLNIQPGDQIADLGSGSGYFTFRLADAVGPTGTVYAVDVDEDMNALLADRVQEKEYTNVKIVLASPSDPNLTDGSIDLVFSSNSYHHLDDRVSYFTRLHEDLKPNGRVAIIDFKDDGGLHPSGHATPGKVIQDEMEEAGYALAQDLDFLPKQGFLIFKQNSP